MRLNEQFSDFSHFTPGLVVRSGALGRGVVIFGLEPIAGGDLDRDEALVVFYVVLRRVWSRFLLYLLLKQSGLVEWIELRAIHAKKTCENR